MLLQFLRDPAFTSHGRNATRKARHRRRRRRASVRAVAVGTLAASVVNQRQTRGVAASPSLDVGPHSAVGLRRAGGLNAGGVGSMPDVGWDTRAALPSPLSPEVTPESSTGVGINKGKGVAAPGEGFRSTALLLPKGEIRPHN